MPQFFPIVKKISLEISPKPVYDSDIFQFLQGRIAVFRQLEEKFTFFEKSV